MEGMTSVNIAGGKVEGHSPLAGVLKQLASEGPLKSFHQQYTLKGKLGAGAFGEVHLAAVIAHGGDVAVKIADLRAAQGGGKRGMVDRKKKSAVVKEVAVLRRVSGLPHCIALCDDYLEGSLSYIIMERCDMTLQQALESAPEVTERTLAGVIGQMLQALAGVHGRLVVHRDVKPENFLCSGEGRMVKLCDFGLAAVLPRCTGELRCRCGTASFMSPEMLRGEGYGTKTDIWSLGVLAYILLCGQHPYRRLESARTDTKAMMGAIEAGVPRPTFQPTASLDRAGTGPSPAAVVVLRLLLDRDRVRRPSAADAVELRWFASPAGPPWDALSFRPTLNAAKRAGALGKHLAPEDCGPSSLDILLAPMQAKHDGDQQHAAGHTECRWHSLDSTCVMTRTGESANPSLTSSDLDRWTSAQSDHPA